MFYFETMDARGNVVPSAPFKLIVHRSIKYDDILIWMTSADLKSPSRRSRSTGVSSSSQLIFVRTTGVINRRHSHDTYGVDDTRLKLCYCRPTARRAASAEILSTAAQLWQQVVLEMWNSLVNKDEYVIYYAYTSAQSVITFDRLGRCYRFVYIYACTLLCFVSLYRFSAKKDLYKSK